MADSKITALTAISTVDPAADPLVIVDVSDTSMAASGTTKKATINQLLGASGTATLASATITGNLTVDTNTFFVDSANNRVIVGHTSGSSAFQVTNAGAAGFEVQPTGVNSAPALLSYNRSSAAWTQMTYLALNHVWQNSGSTAMTLNATGLGVGVTPSAKLDVAVTVADGIRVKNTLATSAYSNLFHISDNTGIALVGYCPSYVGGTNFGVGANGQSIVSDSAGPLAVGTNTAQSLFLGSNGVTRITLDSSGNVISNVPATAPTLGIDRQMVFNLTSNTNLRISVRGTDGTTRTADITLA